MADSSYRVFGYARRGMLFIVALLLLGVTLFGAYQLSIYHRNMAVSDANLPSLPALSHKDRILILSPHPDDETLGAGGLMAKATSMGVPVRVIFLTNGDGSLATRLVQDAQFVEQMAKGKAPKRPRNIYRQIAPMRQKESLAALAKLKVPKKNATFLGYPDGGTKQMWETNWNPDHPFRSPYTKADHSPYANSWTPNAPYCGQQALKDVEQIIAGFKPTIVITTNPYDTHPDHWAAYSYLSAAIAQLQLQQKNVSWAGKIKCYTFIVHHGFWPAPHGYHPNTELSPPADLMDVGASWLQLLLNKNDEKAKADALRQYKSQLATTPQFLRGFLRRNELFAQQKTISHSEAVASWKEIIKGPKNDLLLPQLIPGGDITSIFLKRQGKVLTLRINLARKPWSGINYIVSVHLVNSDAIYCNKINVTANNKQQWQAIIVSLGQKSVAANTRLKTDADNNKIEIRLPLSSLAPKSDANNIFLISATSVFRKRVLDQTPTQIV
ncbi:MAG: PIG-L deacetylase family protein, partial [Abditibacteriaceae bacterium]